MSMNRKLSQARVYKEYGIIVLNQSSIHFS
jgi:hypothetical protein